ncbi:hypothetical protein BDW22DRAFT_1426283 [Trametopsis cervina]|nr:hypothetical protein BDW22DRAFT_1426283 [Trametopsis cervina]
MSVTSNTSAWRSPPKADSASPPGIDEIAYPLLSPFTPTRKSRARGTPPPPIQLISPDGQDLPDLPTQQKEFDSASTPSAHATPTRRAATNETRDATGIPETPNPFQVLTAGPSDKARGKQREGAAAPAVTQVFCKTSTTLNISKPPFLPAQHHPGGPVRQSRTRPSTPLATRRTSQPHTTSALGIGKQPHRKSDRVWPPINGLHRPRGSSPPPLISWLSDVDFWRIYGRLREGDELTDEELDEAIRRFRRDPGDSDTLPSEATMAGRTQQAHDIAAAGNLFRYPYYSDDEHLIRIEDHLPPHRSAPLPELELEGIPMTVDQDGARADNAPSEYRPASLQPSPVLTYHDPAPNLHPPQPPAGQPLFEYPTPPSSHIEPLDLDMQDPNATAAPARTLNGTERNDPVPHQIPPPLAETSIEEPPRPPHTPIQVHTHRLPYAKPGPSWQAPRGNDPGWRMNNLRAEMAPQRKACPGESVLLRQAYEGCPTTKTEAKRIHELSTLLQDAVGNIPGLLVCAPKQDVETTTPRPPPFTFLARGFTPEVRAMLEALQVVSTAEGTIFITPNLPQMDSLIFSLTGLILAPLPEMYAHVQRALDASLLPEELLTTVTSHPHPSLRGIPPVEAARLIRQSLRLSIVTEMTPDKGPRHVMHVFMDPPTLNRTKWRAFQKAALSAAFGTALLGMDMAEFRDWLCDYCHSKLHPASLCPFESETGWYQPPNKPAPKVVKPPPPPPAPTHDDHFTTVVARPAATEASTRNGKGKGGKGRGSNCGRGKGKGRGREPTD